jgi:O-antigen ligase
MPFRIFLVWTFILIGRPQDFFPFLIPLRLALVFAFITLAATFLAKRDISIADLFQISECKKYTFFYLIMIVGIPFAYHRGVAFDYVLLAYLDNMLFFFLFLHHVDSFEKLKTTVFILCVCCLLYGSLSLNRGTFIHGRIFYGTAYDPNDLAYFLVSFLPFCFYFIVNNEIFIKKIIAVVTIAISIIIVLYTGSRGGFIGLATISLLILLTKRGGIKRSHKVFLLTGLTIIFILCSSKIDTERFMTLTEIGNDYNVSDEFGRLNVWKRGLKLALSNPLTGVGVHCFAMAIGYARESEGAIPKWQVAHNSYIQVLTETGIIGFTIFVSICIGCLKNFFYCSKIDNSAPEAEEGIRKLSGWLLIGFIGQLVCASFLTQVYSIIFTSFFALSAVIKRLYDYAAKSPF